MYQFLTIYIFLLNITLHFTAQKGCHKILVVVGTFFSTRINYQWFGVYLVNEPFDVSRNTNKLSICENNESLFENEINGFALNFERDGKMEKPDHHTIL